MDENNLLNEFLDYPLVGDNYFFELLVTFNNDSSGNLEKGKIWVTTDGIDVEVEEEEEDKFWESSLSFWIFMKLIV